jgi:hypothetical protein
VIVDNSDPIYILPNGSVNYNVIAPEVSGLYQEVDYTFKQYSRAPTPDHLMGTIVFPVKVEAFGYFEFSLFNFMANIMMAVGLSVVAIAFVIWQRRLSHDEVRLNKPKQSLFYGLKKNETIGHASCGNCAFFGKPILCKRHEKDSKADPCLLYTAKV